MDKFNYLLVATLLSSLFFAPAPAASAATLSSSESAAHHAHPRKKSSKHHPRGKHSKHRPHKKHTGGQGGPAKLHLPSAAEVAKGGFWDREKMENEAYFGRFEEAVWLADEEDLGLLEAIATRHIQTYPQSARAHYLLAVINLMQAQQGEEDEATLLVNQATQLAAQAQALDPSSPLGYVALAEALRLQGESEIGMQIVSGAMRQVKGDQWRLSFIKARLATSVQKASEALSLRSEFEPLLKNPAASRPMVASFITSAIYAAILGHGESFRPFIGGEDPGSLSPLGAGHEAREAGILELAALDINYPAVAFKTGLARLLFDAGRLPMADGYFTMALQDEPNNRQALFSLGSILAKEGADPLRAISLLERYEQVSSGRCSEKTLAVLEIIKGQAMVTYRDFASARAFYLKAASRMLGDRAQRESDYAVMLESFIEARAPQPETIRLAEELSTQVEGAGVLSAALGEAYLQPSREARRTGSRRGEDEARLVTKAIGYYEDAVTLSPQVGEYSLALGLVCFNSGRLDEAHAALEDAIRLMPGSTQALYTMARLQARRGEKELALATLSGAVAASPSLLTQAREEADFKDLLSDDKSLKKLLKKD